MNQISTAEFQHKVFLCICLTKHVTYSITSKAEFKRKASLCVCKQNLHQTYTHQTAQVLETWSHQADMYAMFTTTCSSYSLNKHKAWCTIPASTHMSATQLHSKLEFWITTFRISRGSWVNLFLLTQPTPTWLITSWNCTSLQHACMLMLLNRLGGQMFGLMHTCNLHRHCTLWVKACAQDLLAAACMSL